MDRLHTMATFVAVVDSQGFAGAARKLNMSAPAVTRAIADLEQRLGVQLLTRTARIVRVTDAGGKYVEDCRRILAEVAEAESAASGVHSKVSGDILITAPVMFGRMCVAPIVREFLERHTG